MAYDNHTLVRFWSLFKEFATYREKDLGGIVSVTLFNDTSGRIEQRNARVFDFVDLEEGVTRLEDHVNEYRRHSKFAKEPSDAERLQELAEALFSTFERMGYQVQPK